MFVKPFKELWLTTTNNFKKSLEKNPLIDEEMVRK
jgi:uncharacterized protein YneF (UPF0154 family)